MRKILVTLALVSGLLFAANANAGAIVAPSDWTTSTEDDANVVVNVRGWFSENGVEFQEVFSGTLAAGARVDVSTAQFVNSGRTICLNAVARDAEGVRAEVFAVPACHTFQAPAPLVPPTTEMP